MAIKESSHGTWSSPLAFILAGAGIAIGFSNFWGLPSLIEEHGGGAFILLYIAGLLLMGLPVLMCEVILGRRGRQSPVNSLHTLGIMAGQHPAWKYLGVACVITAVLILSYYSVIYGWALGYLFRSLAGKFSGQTAQGIASIFSSFVSNPEVLLAWHTVFIVATVAVVARGIRDGLERANRWLIGSLLVILLVLLGHVLTTAGIADGVSSVFAMDFSRLTLRSVLDAMKYAFFSLATGFGLYLIYGAYLPRKISILSASLWIILLDVIVACVAMVIIFTVLHNNALDFSDGDKLLFHAMPLAFGQQVGGLVWSSLFYAALFCAALTSSIALMEAAVSWVIERYSVRRARAAILVGLVCWGIGILTTLSFNDQSPLQFVFRYAGEKRQFGLFNLLEVFAGNIMVPLLAMALLIFTVWYMGRDAVRDELNMREGLVYTVWRGLAGVVAPVLIFMVFLHINGIISFYK